MTIQDKIAALPPEVTNSNYGWLPERVYFEKCVERAEAERDLALEALRFTQCLCSAHFMCDRCAVLRACGGESE